MTGETVLVTGAAGGIGYETARALGALGAHVVVAARENPRGPAAVETISVAGASSEFLPVDMDRWNRCARQPWGFRMPLTSDSTCSSTTPASRSRPGRSARTAGFELTWATNFLGGFLLTRLLLPALERAPALRVVNVSSEGHRGRPYRVG